MWRGSHDSWYIAGVRWGGTAGMLKKIQGHISFLVCPYTTANMCLAAKSWVLGVTWQWRWPASWLGKHPYGGYDPVTSKATRSGTEGSIFVTVPGAERSAALANWCFPGERWGYFLDSTDFGILFAASPGGRRGTVDGVEMPVECSTAIVVCLKEKECVFHSLTPASALMPLLMAHTHKPLWNDKTLLFMSCLFSTFILFEMWSHRKKPFVFWLWQNRD